MNTYSKSVAYNVKNRWHFTKIINNKFLLRKSRYMLLSLFAILSSIAFSAQAATVSVSNYPLFLLSEAVTQGAPSANRLLQTGEVGHHGSVSPGDIKAIQDSTFVVWFGPSLESNLSSSLESAPNTISLLDFDAFNRYPLRDVKGQPIKDTSDPHIYLDPDNAKAITRALAAIHSRANPQYKKLYQENVQKFAQRMDAAVAAQNIKQKKRPYWAYHDAYRYIEKAMQLQFAGSLTVDEEVAPTASQLRWLDEQRPAKRMCLVAQGEPAKGLLAKLQPVNATVQIEDMSTSKDFVQGWKIMAQEINNCIS